MKKAMIHYDPVEKTSENHNNRKVKLNYVRTDLSHLNEKWIDKSMTISEKIIEIQDYCKKKSGRALQKNSIPIREAVVLLTEDHKMSDLHHLANELKLQLGINTFQIFIHRDEGHYDKLTKEWKPNFHAHLVSDFQSKITGKMLGLNKSQMSLMQDIAANCLNMERGKDKGKKRLSALEYKIKKRTEELMDLETKLELFQDDNSSDFDKLMIEEKKIFGSKKLNNSATLENHQRVISELENLIKSYKIDLENLSKINLSLKNDKKFLQIQNTESKSENFQLLTNGNIYGNKKTELINKLFSAMLKDAFDYGFRNEKFSSLNSEEKREKLTVFVEKFLNANNLESIFLKELVLDFRMILSEIENGSKNSIERKVKNIKLKF